MTDIWVRARDQADVSAAGAQASIYGNASQGLGNAVNGYLNNSIYSQQTNALMQPGTVTIGRVGTGGNPSYETLSRGWSGGW
ncbi:hypothetical protein JMJ56_28085 [Belnapia sp. T18]|uniref:Uncharacterized protein n=1 Tax=Belnapia arida TaxID=2804533 RepID=A0ABS1UD23_9PROT|nr:hypothetical protein [Belnapia arida]MBL6081849.1 hypothetical protein [Belnapia arida]